MKPQSAHHPVRILAVEQPAPPAGMEVIEAQLRFGMCGPPSLFVRWNGIAADAFKRRGTGVRYASRRAKVRLEDGWTLIASHAIPGDPDRKDLDVSTSYAELPRSGPDPRSETGEPFDLQRWQMVREGATRARAVVAEVHGWDGPASMGASALIGPFEVTVREHPGACSEGGKVGLWHLRRRDGTIIGRRAAFEAVERLVDVLQVALAQPLSCPAIEGYADGELQCWRMQGPTQPHPESIRMSPLHARTRMGVIAAALRFAEVVWPTWHDADRRFRVGLASTYLSRSGTAFYTDHEARDLAVALETMVKRYTGGAKGDLEPLLLRFEEAIGLGTVISKTERVKFRAWRNQMAHEGVLVPDGEKVPSAVALNQSAGWLRTFVMRHVAAAVGWHGAVIDFGVIPHRPRSVRSMRFAGPRWWPGRP